METEYLASIIEPLVAKKESLRVVRTDDERGILLTVSADARDYGRLIGTAGETARALRTIMNCYGMARGSKMSVKIAAPYKPKNDLV